MGKLQSKHQTNKFLELVGELIVNNKTWVEICMKFEVNFYKKGNEDTPIIKWEEFHEIFLKKKKIFKFDQEAMNNRKKGLAPNLVQSHINFDYVITYYALKEVFETSFLEMRIYRLYILFLVNTIEEDSQITKLNFIELLFEKIIYNIELESKESDIIEGVPQYIADHQNLLNLRKKVLNQSYDDNDLGANLTEIDFSLDKIEVDDNKNNDKNKNTKSKNKNNKADESIDNSKDNSSYFNRSNSLAISNNRDKSSLDVESENDSNESSLLDNTTLDAKLVRMFARFRHSKLGKTKTYVKKMTLSMFKMILYMFFETSIVNILYGYKKALEKINGKKLKLDDVYWNNELKSYIRSNYDSNKIIDLNQFDLKTFLIFINKQMERFVKSRENLQKDINEKRAKDRANRSKNKSNSKSKADQNNEVDLDIEQNKEIDESFDDREKNNDPTKFEYDWLIINFDDVYAFLNNNDYFFSSRKLYRVYIEFLNSKFSSHKTMMEIEKQNAK